MTEEQGTAIAERDTTAPITNELLQKIVKERDLSPLSWEDRWAYYRAMCNAIGLDPLRMPFDFLTDKKTGKVTLYANKEAAAQIREIKRVDIIDLKAEFLGDMYVVTVTARTPDGRVDQDMGIVSVTNQEGKRYSGDFLANKMLAAVTKGKRRVSLSIAGLGFLDETEADSIPGVVMNEARTTPLISDAPASGGRIVDTTTGEIVESEPIAAQAVQHATEDNTPFEAEEPEVPEDQGALLATPQHLMTIRRIGTQLGRVEEPSESMTVSEAMAKIKALSAEYNNRNKRNGEKE